MLSTDGWCVPDYIHTDLQKCWCMYSSTGLYIHKIPCVYQKFPLNSTPTTFKYLKKKGSERKKFCSKLWTSLQGCQYPWAGEPPCLLLPSGLHSSFSVLEILSEVYFRWQVTSDYSLERGGSSPPESLPVVWAGQSNRAAWLRGISEDEKGFNFLWSTAGAKS